MWLVFCSAQDVAALWAYKGLERRGLRPIEVLTDELLAYCLRFEHRIQAGMPITRITLTKNRVIEGATIRGTLNRLQTIPTRHLHHVEASDRQYAEQELYALFLSWLYGLPGPQVNRATPQGLGGAWRHLSEWIWLAGRCGLSTLPYRQDDTQSMPISTPLALLSPNQRILIVFNGKCFGSLAPPSVQQGCIHLAKLSQTPLLGMEFQVNSDGNWMFTNATPMPDLRLGGETFLDELAKVLKP